jgi:hypothetical protein
MDELLETSERPTHTHSIAFNPYKTILNPLRIAALVLCMQLLPGCGGGATELDTASDSYTSGAYNSDTYTCTYFIDAVTGSDTNSGTSPEDAWATANRAVAHTRSPLARPGDALCFKRGQRFEVFEGRLGASGSAAAPVVIGAYGDPSLTAPRLSPAIRIDNSPGWVNLGNNVYYWPNIHASWNASGLWRAGVWQRPATSQELRDGDWYYAKGSGVYLRTPGAPGLTGAIHLDIRFGTLNVHGLRYIAFRDLIFEYAGAAISGRPVVPGGERPTSAIAYLSIRNCQFKHVATGVGLFSESVNGVSYENHHIDISGNQFNDIRFAIRLGSVGNGPERNSHVAIVGNTIRDIAVNGRYVGSDKLQDIEAIAMQNPIDVRITSNRIENGLRLGQGFTTIEGEPLLANGIILWRHSTAVFDRVRVERNYVRGMEYGNIIGSGTQEGMHEVTVTNNLVLRCAVGLKANGTGIGQSYHVRFNTLFQNGINLFVMSPSGLIVVNNFSIEPREYHLALNGMRHVELDYNAYAPNGRFLLVNTSDAALNRQLEDLQALQAEQMYGQLYDEHSIVVDAAGLVKSVPYMPEDFRLTEASPAYNRGMVIGLGDGDFGGRARFASRASDIGAWARYPTDN